MEELEDPTERLKETMEAAEEKKERWTMHVALSTAIIAVLAAIAGLYGNHHANEAMLDQIKESDQWAYYQAKGIKYVVIENKIDLLKHMGKEINPKDQEKADKLKQSLPPGASAGSARRENGGAASTRR